MANDVDLKQFHVLLVNPNSEERNRLRSVTSAIAYLGQTDYVKTCKEASAKLASGARYDVLAVSSRFPIEEAVPLIRESRTLQVERKCAYLVALAPEHVGGAVTAAFFRATMIDGFLIEPYVADKIQQVLVHAFGRNLPQLSDQERTVAAAGLLLPEAAACIDRVATTLAQGRGVGDGHKNFKQVSKQLRELDGDVPIAVLEQMLIKRFETARIPKDYQSRRNQDVPIGNPAAPHPGSVIKQIMTKRNIAAERLISALGLEESVFELILQEKKAIDAQMAGHLARMLGNTAAYWLELQKKHDLGCNSNPES